MNPETIAVGDMVEVVRSPYRSVAHGTVAKVQHIRRDHLREGVHLYVLEGLPHRNFWGHEIRLRLPKERQNGHER